MRYFRMLSNSLIAAAAAASWLGILFLQLNPALRLDDPAVWALAGRVAAAYGVHLTVFFYGVIVLRLVVSTEPFSPGWVSVRVLTWSCAGASIVVAALMWLNLRGLRLALDADAARRLAVGATALTICAAAFLALAIVRYSFGRRGSLASAMLFAVVLAASVAVPLAARGPGEVPEPPSSSESEPLAGVRPPGRVTLLLLDGASLDFISPAAADGRLPNFGRLLDRGASMHLATLRPTQPTPVWTAVATGKLPPKTGIRSAATYRGTPGGPAFDLLPDLCLAHALVTSGLLAETSHSSTALRARPFWTLLGNAGLATAVVRWPLTTPAGPVRGFLISDDLHLASATMLALGESAVTYPRELGAALRLTETPPDPLPGETLPPGMGPGDDFPAAAALALDRFYAGVAARLAAGADLQVTAVRYQGLDVVGHYYLRQALPRAFGDVSEEERRRYGRVVELYYRYLDAEVGRALASLPPDGLLMVVSGFGMEPMSLAKRALERVLGNEHLSGTHERAPDGFLLAFGAAVKPGRLPRASVVDVTPTLLYYLGLPVGRDMDGFARTDVFAREFTEERPLTFIPTYERSSEW